MYKDTKFNKRFAFWLGLLALVFLALFIVFGGLTLTTSPAQSPFTVSEVINNKSLVNQQIRVSGAVVGESIIVDSQNQQLSFLLADIPTNKTRIEQEGGIDAVLENAVSDPDRQRLQILYVGDKPDPLANMVHAVILGKLHSDGIFYADGINLVFSSSYEDFLTKQAD